MSRAFWAAGADMAAFREAFWEGGVDVSRSALNVDRLECEACGGLGPRYEGPLTVEYLLAIQHNPGCQTGVLWACLAETLL